MRTKQLSSLIVSFIIINSLVLPVFTQVEEKKINDFESGFFKIINIPSGELLNWFKGIYPIDIGLNNAVDDVTVAYGDLDGQS